MLFNGEIQERFPIFAFDPGDEIEMRMPGGAGFGPVAEREREKIVEDLRLGYISRETAQSVYGLSEEDAAESR